MPDVAGLPQFDGCPDKDAMAFLITKMIARALRAHSSSMDVLIQTATAFLIRLIPAPANPDQLLPNGCPDRDGDLVPDFRDRCPDVAGRMDNYGCPGVHEEELNRVKLSAKPSTLNQEARRSRELPSRCWM
jgi:hypothetical protein